MSERRKAANRLTKVSVLVKTILGGKVVLQVNAKLEVTLHQGLVDLVPDAFSLHAEDAVQLLEGQSLLFLGIGSNSTIDQI